MDIDDIRAMLTKFRKKCMDETKTNLETIEDTEFGIFPEEESLKCYFKCVFEKFHMMDKDGKIKYNILKKAIPDVYKEIGNEMVDSCKHIDSENKCEKSFMFMKCMYNVNPWNAEIVFSQKNVFFFRFPGIYCSVIVVNHSDERHQLSMKVTYASQNATMNTSSS
ncbi:hypothetical protein E2986_03428 [Frieseomelitta varia]|uniref:Odorant-binding protein n=1 Tax=Frieseomelitta varia TaxID=561572 RepID=A0A833RM87_9HYME|nr:hypothetical protein E2986_03428 [Frieseomelitta varia]